MHFIVRRLTVFMVLPLLFAVNVYDPVGQSGVVRVGPARTPVAVSIAPNPSHLEVNILQDTFADHLG